jgi:hypothetical protein
MQMEDEDQCGQLRGLCPCITMVSRLPEYYTGHLLRPSPYVNLTDVSKYYDGYEALCVLRWGTAPHLNPNELFSDGSI